MAARHIAVQDGLDEAVEAAAEVMENGGVAIFPTETVYGIGVVSGDAAALDKLRRLKERGPDKPFQYLVADAEMAKAMGAVFPGRAGRLANHFWPGPMTMVVPDGTGGNGTLGLRVPNSPFVLALLERLRRPIISSSANHAGEEPPCDVNAADVFAGGPDGVELVVDGGPVMCGLPSTVVRCFEGGFEILREGSIDNEALRVAWEE
ncbi:MAG: threonylcarbamoyl-AMP synthase [Planctomycetaceae bacterium]|nr:threonylcarbamoyl-AMP synthase [Planctomycetaceae bacterium]